MAQPKIVGYGIVGPKEPFLEQTLREFARLCDEVILCLNNPTEREVELIKKYNFNTVTDNSEWGRYQWKIKEDFVTKHVSRLHPDLLVCLDMDERFDKHLTKEGLYKLYEQPFEAFYFRIINLWDDGYAPDRSFWNIRAWKYREDFGTQWPRKNLHCGLAPEWTWTRAYYSPYIVIHSGLKDKERRELKAQRYDKYDPNAKFMSKDYYDSLRLNAKTLPFDENALHEEVVKYVHDIKQKYIKPHMISEDLMDIRIPSGEIIPVPKNKVNDYVKRPGHTVVGPHKSINVDVLDEILDAPEPVQEPEVEEPKVLGKVKKWSWQK